MKYIDAEKLIAEIERRILQEQDFEDGDAEYGYKCALKDIKRFITSHQQEQPEVDLDVEINLGNEVENFCLEYDARKDAWYNMTPRDQKLLSNPTWLNFAINIARHFYELGLKARKK